MKLSGTFFHKPSTRREFLIENLNKLAIWSERSIWLQFFEYFCAIHKERQKPVVEKQSSAQSVMKMFSQTLFKNSEAAQPTFSQKVREDALDDLGILLFTIKFQYEFIADTLIQVAEEHSVDRKCVFRILIKNEEKLVRELFDKQRDIDISNI